MKSYIKPLKLAVVTVALGILFGQQCNAANTNAWRLQNAANSKISIVQSSQAQEGKMVLLIDGTDLVLPEDYTLSSDQFSVKGYAVQTVDAQHLKAKHFHISGFAKSSFTGFDEFKNSLKERYLKKLTSQFEAHVESMGRDLSQELREWHEETVGFQIEYFTRLIDSLHANADFGIKVLLHMKAIDGSNPRVEQYLPTSAGSPNHNGQWNRFNIEVSIPKNCMAISIVLWSKGINIVQFDHMAMVEHGESLIKQKPDDYLSRFDDLYDYFKQSDLLVNPLFVNPSFEF